MNQDELDNSICWELYPRANECDVFSLEDFLQMRGGMLLPYDGHGYFANDDKMSNVNCFDSSVPFWATKVVWFNK